MKNSNNQNGRSMIEMLGVLAIIGVLSVGGIDMDETGHCKNAAEALQISFQGIPQEACIDIASQDWSNLNPELIYINTALDTVVNSGLRIKSVDDAITNCSSASDNTINFLIK